MKRTNFINCHENIRFIYLFLIRLYTLSSKVHREQVSSNLILFLWYITFLLPTSWSIQKLSVYMRTVSSLGHPKEHWHYIQTVVFCCTWILRLLSCIQASILSGDWEKKSLVLLFYPASYPQGTVSSNGTEGSILLCSRYSSLDKMLFKNTIFSFVCYTRSKYCMCDFLFIIPNTDLAGHNSPFLENASLSLVTGDFAWQPWFFKYFGEWLGNHISQFL